MAAAKKNYYDILGVAPDATAEELKSAYRQKALELHPDLNGGSQSAEECFKRMTEAYAVLRDGRSRAVYDAMRVAGAGQGQDQDKLDVESALKAMFESPEFRKMFQGLATKLVTRGLSPAGLFKGGLGATGIWFAGALFIGGGKAILPKLAGTAAKNLLGSGVAYALGKKVGAAKRGVESAIFEGEEERKKEAVPKDTHFTLVLGLELLKSGGKVSLQIPGDKGSETISVAVAPGSENGKRLRLPGKGSGGGDLIIEIIQK